MKIGNIFQSRLNNNLKTNKANSNPINFNGNKKLQRAVALVSTPLALGVTMGQDALSMGDVFVVSANATTLINPLIVNGTNTPATNNTKLNENNDFQLAQTMDCPSITFDFTSNFKPKANEPVATSIVLTTNPNKNHIEEFRYLSDVITQICGIEPNDTQEVYNKAMEIIQTMFQRQHKRQNQRIQRIHQIPKSQ